LSSVAGELIRPASAVVSVTTLIAAELQEMSVKSLVD
jgi:hypothetical protein